MNPVPIGTRIRPVKNSNSHNYEVGRIYTVSHIAGRAFQAIDAAGQVGNWLAWDDCEPVAGFGWAYCQEILPPEVTDFLSAFQGIEAISLKPVVKDTILSPRPDLHHAILAASRALRKQIEDLPPPNSP